MAKIKTQRTPNPDSLKFEAGGEPFMDGGMESFNNAAEAQGHALGERLFAIPGVANVFILPQFMTVTKHPASDWNQLLPKLEDAIEDYFNGQL